MGQQFAGLSSVGDDAFSVSGDDEHFAQSD